MRNLFLMLLSFVVLMNISCKRDKQIDTKVDTAITKGGDLNATKTNSTVAFSDQHTQQVYNTYLKIKGALVNGDSETVSAHSEKLQSLAKNNNELIATAKLIALTKDIKKQRDFFVGLTVQVEQIIENATVTEGEIYKQFCPMAFDGEGGYWFSDSKEIRNPYYGVAMLNCGEVKKTIKTN